MSYQNRIKDVDDLKKKIDQFRPIPQNALKQIKEYYRIGLTYSSNAIEGNTLTETETKIVLEDGLTIAGKPLRDHYEASGHSEAFDKLLDLSQNTTISEPDILEIHRLFYYRINADNAGRYRNIPVIITGTDYLPPPPSKVPELMQNLILNIDQTRKTAHPIELAATAHLNLVGIHPFVDGNGRTARLLMNLVLFQEGHVITIIPPILRGDYISLIKEIQTTNKDPRSFTNFISCMVYESTKDYLRLLEHIAK